MKLHENEQLFRDAIYFASQPSEQGGLGISPLFLEKDYWVSRALRLMALGDKDGRAVFKGGTSLSKAYGIGARFSEDVDVAIAGADALTGNQLKGLIRKTAQAMTQGLVEVVVPGKTSKGSRYYKAYYQYPQLLEASAAWAITPGQILVEINSFANPYPCERLPIQSFLTTFFQQSGNETLIEEFDMQPFVVTVLDKRRTLTEKLVSLIRCSLANDYKQQLSAKIRHVYDLYYMLDDSAAHAYLASEAFRSDFRSLLAHDQQLFAQPEGWQARTLSESPLLTNFDEVWSGLEPVYVKELTGLAYRQIPTPAQIAASMRVVLQSLNFLL